MELKELIGYGVAILMAVFAGLLEIFKNKKIKKVNNELKDTQDAFIEAKEDVANYHYGVELSHKEAFLKEKVIELMKGAEQTFKGKEGAKKLDNVILHLKMLAMEIGFQYDENYWKSFIEQMIEFSKTVNKKEN